MDNIKFRAFHRLTKEIFGVYSFSETHVFKDSYAGFGDSRVLPSKRGDCVLMQYTQLKDKNGIEIYFDDFVAIHNIEGKIESLFKVCCNDKILGVYLLEWDRDEWDSNLSLESNNYDDIIGIVADCEVIGNFWQNLEYRNPI